MSIAPNLMCLHMRAGAPSTSNQVPFEEFMQVRLFYTTLDSAYAEKYKEGI